MGSMIALEGNQNNKLLNQSIELMNVLNKKVAKMFKFQEENS